tara:strand:+ start:1579 stop:2841 length:1263 start_codon:yes stop_codon:yes gene_type:complete
MKKVISLFSGCGGMDLGFEGDFKILKKSYNRYIHPDWNIVEDGNFISLPKTSFSTVLANDILESAKKAWIPFFQNKTDGKFLHGSIIDFVKSGDVNKFKRKGIDVVTGGFPCQDFSLAGKRKGFNSHKSHLNKKFEDDDFPSVESRGMLYYWMREVVNIIQPKVFVAENVKGLKSMNGVIDTIKRDFEQTGDNGYLVIEPKVINACNYGIPQNRERIFFFGFNQKYMKKSAINAIKNGVLSDDINPFPKITHNDTKNIELFEENNKVLDLVTSQDAFIELNEPESETLDQAQQFFSKAKFFKGTQGNSEVKLHRPGPTIRAEHHGNIEYRRLSEEKGGKNMDELNFGLKERRLTVRECARIQSFPDNYEFVRTNKSHKYPLSASAAYKLIGNAVPPLLGFHIAQKLDAIWENIFLKKYIR